MPNVNHMILQGHLGRDPEGKYTAKGTQVASFSIAYSQKKDGPTTWFRCEAFGKTAELILEYCSKGSAPLLQGRIECQEYEKDGEKKQAWKFIVEKLLAFGPRSEPKQPAATRDTFDDDAPF